MEKQFNFYFILLLIAILSDLITPFLLAFKYPGYSHLNDVISLLGADNSPVKRWEGLNLIFVGALFIVFALGQKAFFSNMGCLHYCYFIGILAFGLGCVFAGIFPADARGIGETFSGKVHGITSGIGFMLLLLCPLWAVFIGEFKSNSIPNIILFILSLSTFVLFVISENIDTGVLRYTGLYQRLNLLVMYLCLLMNFMYMLRPAE
ncbi:MAG: DUF998 domain-containing protein [Hyphomicrobiales bacterium]